jgi:hypothetical protein
MIIFYTIDYYINPILNSSNSNTNVELYLFYISENDYTSYK